MPSLRHTSSGAEGGRSTGLSKGVVASTAPTSGALQASHRGFHPPASSNASPGAAARRQERAGRPRSQRGGRAPGRRSQPGSPRIVLPSNATQFRRSRAGVDPFGGRVSIALGARAARPLFSPRSGDPVEVRRDLPRPCCLDAGRLFLARIAPRLSHQLAPTERRPPGSTRGAVTQ